LLIKLKLSVSTPTDVQNTLIRTSST